MGKQFANVPGAYGAPLGRSSWLTEPETACRLFRVNLDSGGYDDGGAYWGCDYCDQTGEWQYLWCCADDAEFRYFCRAPNRRRAQQRILSELSHYELHFKRPEKITEHQIEQRTVEGWEVIHTTSSLTDARQALHQYRLNQPHIPVRYRQQRVLAT